ncbi:hypothetical protein K504DRAFT_99651 [Pleomassaria siparia CBS 279.74]|uniref:Uncharacterized protein n=1 Tax=Pleomassaria siparia CBS 279.74 TaxID=1314801 RepID=A0A6G1JXI6_9PLEO|nr:hypothetical protein K504DRAFT_99651 [Pleomassaria siparia CBS 279.74]
MTPSNEPEWTILSRNNTNTNTNNMATNTATPTQAAAPAPSSAIELTIHTKPNTDASPTEKKECTCGAQVTPPKLERNNTLDSYSEDEFLPQPRGGRSIRRAPIRRNYSVSPVRRRRPVVIQDETTMITSSYMLLSKVGNYDGVVDLPLPAFSSAYLATFPFTDKDVKKWAWLMARGVEDTYMNQPRDRDEDDDDDYPRFNRMRGGRNRSPYYEPVVSVTDIPSLYVSRALETSVIPENTREEVRYMIVIQNRNRPQGCKLLVAESRKAAAIMMYYEALSGNSVVFVGAVVDQTKKLAHKKLVRVETLEEAIELTADGNGDIGVIC